MRPKVHERSNDLSTYIRELVEATDEADDAGRRAFVAQHAAVLGGYSAYFLNLRDVELEESFSDALLAAEGDWPGSFTGYRLAFPVRLTEGADNQLMQARALWRRAAAGRRWRAGRRASGGGHTRLR